MYLSRISWPQLAQTFFPSDGTELAVEIGEHTEGLEGLLGGEWVSSGSMLDRWDSPSEWDCKRASAQLSNTHTVIPTGCLQSKCSRYQSMRVGYIRNVKYNESYLQRAADAPRPRCHQCAISAPSDILKALIGNKALTIGAWLESTLQREAPGVLWCSVAITYKTTFSKREVFITLTVSSSAGKSSGDICTQAQLFRASPI